MNLSRCMTRECKNCRYESSCFKEYNYGNKSSRNKSAKKSRIQSKKRINTSRSRISTIEKSIVEFGYVVPVVINSDMTVIGGHQGLKVLEDLGYKKIECSVQNLDKTHEKALNLALNKINGIWDNEKLEKILAELKELEFDMDITGFSADELNEIFNDTLEATEDDLM